MDSALDSRSIRVRGPSWDIALCSWARHSHSASLHPGVQMGTGGLDDRGNPVMD